MTKKKNNRPPSRGTLQEFDSLHAELARSMTDELRRCRASGEPPNPSFLQAVRQMLKDNGVDQPARVSELDRLAGMLPDMDALERGDGVVVPIRKEGVQ